MHVTQPFERAGKALRVHCITRTGNLTPPRINGAAHVLALPPPARPGTYTQRALVLAFGGLSFPSNTHALLPPHCFGPVNQGDYFE